MARNLKPLFLILILFSVQIPTGLAFDVLQALPKNVHIPIETIHNKQSIELGKQLFFDARLLGIDQNGSPQASCNHCHNIFLGADSSRSLSLGFDKKTTKRNAPTLWNIAFQTVLFWDGRAKSLETAIKSHLLNASVSNWYTLDDLVMRLNAIPGYRIKFKAVYGSRSVRYNDIANALASYLRTLVTSDSDFDRFIQGDVSAMSQQAQQGLFDFNEVGCIACHFGMTFSGPAPGPFLKMGDGFYELFPNYRGSLYEEQYSLADDVGRFQYSGIDTDKHMFRVPPLRNIAITGPYFHNGSVATLSEAIRVMARTELNAVLSEDEVSNIKSFLEALTGRRPEQRMPILPMSSVQ